MGKSKWERITSLKIQHINGSSVRASDLVWTKVKGDTYARIPFDKVGAFMLGESTHEDYPTQFFRVTHRTNCATDISAPRHDSFIEYDIWWCAYGYEDFRQKATSERKAKESGKRGCRCHFIIKRLCKSPDSVVIQYNVREHVDLHGMVCHGRLDLTADGRVLQAPYLSCDLARTFEAMFHEGVTVHTAYVLYIKEIKNHLEMYNEPADRDDYDVKVDIMNIYAKLTRQQFQRDTNDPMSVELWYQEKKDSFFFYQKEEMRDGVGTPLVVGLQTSWMLNTMVEFSHNSLICMHSIAKAKKYLYHLCTMMVFDTHQNGIPVAWVITSHNRSEDVQKWLKCLIARGLIIRPDWRISTFMMDDASLEIDGLRVVTGCPILLSLWHVRRAWLKHLIAKVRDEGTRWEMLRSLGDIMHQCRTSDSVHATINIFKTKYAYESAFMQYFNYTWLEHGRLEMWAKAFRQMQHTNQEIDSCIESYHAWLKSKYLCNMKKKKFKRVDWLIYTLLSKVEVYYWNAKHMKEIGFVHNLRLETMQSSSWARANCIQDVDCLPHESISNAYWVKSQTSTRLVKYIIRDVGSPFAICDCPWAQQGNLCKHVIKVNMLLRDKSLNHAPVVALATSSPILGTSLHLSPPTTDDIVHTPTPSMVSDIVHVPHSLPPIKIPDPSDAREGNAYNSFIDLYRRQLCTLLQHPPKQLQQAKLVTRRLSRILTDCGIHGLDADNNFTFDIGTNVDGRTTMCMSHWFSPSLHHFGVVDRVHSGSHVEAGSNGPIVPIDAHLSSQLILPPRRLRPKKKIFDDQLQHPRHRDKHRRLLDMNDSPVIAHLAMPSRTIAGNSGPAALLGAGGATIVTVHQAVNTQSTAGNSSSL